MNNLEFLELVIEATQIGMIKWHAGKKGVGVFIEREFAVRQFANGYRCEVGDYLIDLYLEENGTRIFQKDKPKNRVAIVIQVDCPKEGLIFSMTSDSDIAMADISEPKFHCLATLYFLVKRSWHKWVNNAADFRKMYPKSNGEPGSLFPKGWMVSEVFSSRPVMEGL